MKYFFLLLTLFFTTRFFGQTDIRFFEDITKKEVIDIHAQLTSLGYTLTRVDTSKQFYAWENQLGSGFIYHRVVSNISQDSIGADKKHTSFKEVLAFKYISNDMNKYHSIQSSIDSSNKYSKGPPIQIEFGIKTVYTRGNTEVTIENINKPGNIFYRINFIVNYPQ